MDFEKVCITWQIRDEISQIVKFEYVLELR